MPWRTPTKRERAGTASPRTSLRDDAGELKGPGLEPAPAITPESGAEPPASKRRNHNTKTTSPAENTASQAGETSSPAGKTASLPEGQQAAEEPRQDETNLKPATTPEAAVQGKRRPRWAPEELLRDAVIGFIGDAEEDPPQAGSAVPRQSKEIQTLASVEGAVVPIAKEHRSKYVWVAAAKPPPSPPTSETGQPIPRRPKKYTWNPDDMGALEPSFTAAYGAENRCDLCGVSCVEVLYEFRCYRRLRVNDDRPHGGRRLHPFVSYISKECGRGLLGVQSEASKLREKIYRLVSESDGQSAVQTLQDLWQTATRNMKALLTEELRQLARTEAGVPRRAAEMRKAEALHGELHKDREDVFRAVGRCMAPTLNARDLAGVTVRRAEEEDEEVQGKSKGLVKHTVKTQSFLAEVAEALRERRPLPTAPMPWSRQEVVDCLEALVKAWAPLQVELLDALHGPQVFQSQERSRKRGRPKTEQTEVALIKVRLVYLPGCGELHALSAQVLEKTEAAALRAPREAMLQQCKEDFAPLEALHGGQGRYSRAEDKAIEVPAGSIKPEDVVKALGQITWPNCFSRNNVRPEGAPFIEAFPLGVVLNYCLGLVCSRPTRLWPNLTKLLARWLAQAQPDFRYTTMQLNKNYATKMHVDANNHGPSFIIGLGDYEGGELWILDEENGDTLMELPCTMRGYPHLKAGEKYPGRLVSCHNTWLKFDGNVPHMTMPYTGSRISIVFFTRRGWLKMLPETKELLDSLEFLLPDESYLDLSTEKKMDGSPEEKAEKEVKKVARAPKPAQQVQFDESLMESGDEIDEDEKVDQVLRDDQDAAKWPAWDWAARLCERLTGDRTRWSSSVVDAHRPLVITCTAVTHALALQELLPETTSLRLLAASDLAGGPTALRLLKRSCRAEHAFAELAHCLDGFGHCDVHHHNCQCGSKPAGQQSKQSASNLPDEDILVAGFPAEPFVNQDPSRPSCFDDPSSLTFRSVRHHIVRQQPCIALLEAEGMQEIPEASRAGVSAFLLDGVDPRGADSPGGPESIDWGLRRLAGYGVAYVELPRAALGLPLAGFQAHLLLVRDDCGGLAAAEAAVQLLRWMSSGPLLPRCSVSELLFALDDPRVMQAHRETLAREKAVGKIKPPSFFKKIMKQEVQNLGLQPGEAPYTDLLKNTQISSKGRQGGEPGSSSQTVAWEVWMKHAADEKVIHVNLIYERARQSGVDMEYLCSDLTQGLKVHARRDDGLLPRNSLRRATAQPVASTTAALPQYYTFAQHRVLTGQELLLCHGYPLRRLDLKGLSDMEAIRLATASTAVPVLGAALATLLAVVDLGPGRQLQIPKPQLAELLQQAVAAAAAPAAVAAKEGSGQAAHPMGSGKEQSNDSDALNVAADVSSGQAVVDAEEVRLESKAAALLNLVSHSRFGAVGGSAPTSTSQKPGSNAASSLRSMLSHVADQDEPKDDEGVRGVKRAVDGGPKETTFVQAPVEEPKDWATRLRKLKVMLDPLSMEVVLRWTTEALDDAEADLSSEIVNTGISHLLERFSEDARSVPEAMLRGRQELVSKLQAAGYESHSKYVDAALKTAQFAQGLHQGNARVSLSAQSSKTMANYINTVVRGCDRSGWPMRRLLLDHIGQIAKKAYGQQGSDDSSKSESSKSVLEGFSRHDGWSFVVTWLFEATRVHDSSSLESLASAAAAAAALETVPTTTLEALCLAVLPTSPVRLPAALYSAAATRSAESAGRRCVERLEKHFVSLILPLFGQEQKDVEAGETHEQALASLEELAGLETTVGLRFRRTQELFRLSREVEAGFTGTEQGEAAHRDSEASNGSNAQEQQQLDFWKGLEVKLRQMLDGRGHLDKGDEGGGAPRETNTSSWGALSKLEAKLAESRLDKVSGCVTEADDQERALRREQQAQALLHAKEKAEGIAGTLLDLLCEDGRLKQHTGEGLQILLATLQSLREAAAVLVPTPPAAVSEAMAGGEKSLQLFSEQPFRCGKALQWLQGKDLGHCAGLLDSEGLLYKFHKVAESKDALAKIGLPCRCKEMLNAKSKELNETQLAPKEVPAGWERRLSRSVGLHYFQEMGGKQRMQWEWPVPPGVPCWTHDFCSGATGICSWQEEQEEKVLAEHSRVIRSAGPSVPGRAAYFESRTAGVSCLICHREERDEAQHLQSKDHCRLVAQWQACSERLAMLRFELRRAKPADENQCCQPGLLVAWRGELWQALRANPSPPHPVLSTFWHRVVLPCLGKSTNGDQKPDLDIYTNLEDALDRSLAIAKGISPDKPQTPLPEDEKKLDAAVRELKVFVNASDSDCSSEAKLNVAVGALRQLRSCLSMAPLSQWKAPAGEKAWAVLHAGEAAVRSHCLGPARRAAAQAWLVEQGLPHCTKLLEARGLLQRLHSLTSDEVKAIDGLPRRCKENITKALEQGTELTQLSDDHVSSPAGWEMVFSRTIGLYYYRKLAPDKQPDPRGKTQWQRPYSEMNGESPKEEPVLDVELTRGKPVPGAVPYVEIDSQGDVICLLCKQRGVEHFAGPGHRQCKHCWDALQDRLGCVEREMRTAGGESSRTSGEKGRAEAAALAEAWLGEIRHAALVDKEDASENSKAMAQVRAVFWHLVLASWISKPAKSILDFQRSLDAALTAAWAPEPRWEALQCRLPAALRPRHDIPWPSDKGLKLSASTPPEVFDALSAQALLRQGVSAQDDGSLWCAYCEKIVLNLREHLVPPSLEAQQHFKAKSAVTPVVQRLHKEGWALRREGLRISQLRYSCSLCNATGSWSQIWAHRESEGHTKACAALKEDVGQAAVQARKLTSRWDQEEMDAWLVAFGSMNGTA